MGDFCELGKLRYMGDYDDLGDLDDLGDSGDLSDLDNLRNLGDQHRMPLIFLAPRQIVNTFIALCQRIIWAKRYYMATSSVKFHILHNM